MKLTAIQFAEVKKCKTPEEVVEKAKAHGIEMTLEEAQEALATPAIMELEDDDLASVAGGCDNADHVDSVPCRKCGGTAVYGNTDDKGYCKYHRYFCSCGAYTDYVGDEFLLCSTGFENWEKGKFN